MLASLAPARRRLVLALMAAVLAGALTLVVVALTRGGSDQRSGPVAQDRPGPVLLVPGYGGSTSSLESLQAALRAAGKDTEIVSLPDRAQGDLDAQADALDQAVAQALQRTGASSVDVVGYSAGGVVARLWVSRHGGASLARRVVTLGAPQHGTQIAEIGSLIPGDCPLACQELAPNSPVLAALNQGDETPAGPAWVSVWTTKDTTVLPPDSARLSGAMNLTVQSLCPTDTVDHGGLPRDAVVHRIVIAALGVRLRTAGPGC